MAILQYMHFLQKLLDRAKFYWFLDRPGGAGPMIFIRTELRQDLKISVRADFWKNEVQSRRDLSL